MPESSRFCPACGTAFDAPGPPSGPPQHRVIMPNQPSYGKANPWWYVLGGVGVVLAAIVGLGLAGVLQFPWANRSKTLPAVAEGPRPVLQLPNQTGPPVTPVQRERKEMPADIRAWLEHLERIERKKNALHVQQSTEIRTVASLGMLGQMKDIMGSLFGDDAPIDTTPDPESGTSFRDIAFRVRRDWVALRQEFHTMPPPEDCKPLAREYDGALMQVPGVVGDMLEMLGAVTSENAQNIRRSLVDVQTRHQQYIDEPLKRSDRLLGEICDKYETRKWFTISPDLPGGTLGKFGGL